MPRVVVIGAGVAGLVAAIRLASGGAQVVLLHKGTGGLQLSQGTLDILGYAPERVTRPLDALSDFLAANPGHPYHRLPAELVREAVEYVRDLVGPGLLVGDPDVNLHLPTAVGAIRPTALASPSMLAGAVSIGSVAPLEPAEVPPRFVIVGLRQLKDFYPQLVAENLSRSELPGGGGLTARAVMLDFPARDGEVDSSGLTYARAFDDPAFRRRFVAALKGQVQDDETVGLPAVLGLDDPGAWAEIAEQLGRPVFEIPLPPPSVPGMRLNRMLTALAKQAGVRIVPGSRVTRGFTADGRVSGVELASAGSSRLYEGDAFVLAAGGFEAGALELDSYGKVRETLFDLPLVMPSAPLVHGDYWGSPQPLFTVGLAVTDDMLVTTPEGEPVFNNLYAAGGILAGATRWQEKSGEGIAVASALRAADVILATVPATTEGARS
jgi:glycerol-3-phosphate dehydrogenase subunit B